MNIPQQTDQSKGRKIEMVIQQLDSLPTLPAVAARLLEITVKSNTQAQEVVRLIESDPSLASRIIAMSVRASMEVDRRTSSSLNKAVVLLGFDAVRNAVLSIKVFETLNKNEGSNDKAIFDRVSFWKHSLAVACGAKMLIRHIDTKVDPDEAFVCGLLHDIGKVALDCCLPKSFARVVQLTESSMTNIAEVEKRIIGLDHCAVGRRLAEKWRLPEAIIETVWLHHQWIHGLPDAVKNASIVQTVHLADVLARQFRMGYSGNHYLPDSAETIAQELGCPDSVIEHIARQLPDEISERASLMGLDDIEPKDIYHEALKEANCQLGKLNTKLQHQNQTLWMRSRYFDSLEQLGSSVQPGQSVVDVCSLIARIWQAHTGCDRCGVYATTEDELIIEGAVRTNLKSDPTIFMVDRTDDPAAIGTRGGSMEFPTNFAISPAQESHDWFFEQVDPMFEARSTLVMPLRLGDELAGGVLWQSDKDQGYYKQQIKEMQSFAASAALMVCQAQKQEKQSIFCDQLAQNNMQLQKIQQELSHKRSLAAVGEMACGAAHEINNPLAVVVGRSQLLASGETDSEKKKILETIASNGQEISKIITELLEFAKPALPKPSTVSAEALITRATSACAEAAQAGNVVIDTLIDEYLPDVFVDLEQTSSALSEVLANAIESYQNREEGTVTITAGYDELDEKVFVEIKDHGCGMDKDTLHKATSPFFSGKQAGRKRGLGLSRSVRNIESNRGTLHLQSEPGKGCCARIALPILRTPVADEAALI